MKDTLLGLVKNWKTTMSGLFILGLLFAYLKGGIDKEQMELAIFTLTGLGLVVSKDGSQTGVIKNGSDTGK